MNKRKLGRTDLHVSELNLNTDQFGWHADEAGSFALLDAYHACGGSFIQTVGRAPDLEPAALAASASEDIVGRWRETRGIARDGLVLASRLALVRPRHGGSIAFANHIRETCERSLRRLRTTHVDLLICEWDEDLHPVDDVLEAVDQLIRAGFVRYAVADGFPSWRVVDSLHRSHHRKHARFEALQARYSLMNRSDFEREALAMCREHRLGFLATSPLAGGFLARRPSSSLAEDRDWQDERFGSPVGDAVLQALADVAEKRLGTPAQIALAWVLRNPQVSSVAISAANTRDLRELMRAAGILLSVEESNELANIGRSQASTAGLHHV